MWFSKISRDFSGICKVRLLGLRQPMVNEATQVSRISYKKFLGLRVAYLPHVKLKKKKIGILNFELYFLFGASLTCPGYLKFSKKILTFEFYLY